ncbi:ABC-type sugar transport system, permease component [Longilinea arvoryzae]|uniref:ABC-type sugar transport system, permease component n=1 Tax=Longilinea arvoryzae TaxID=360412 RepID=A0A0S7BIC7_9CHLR|nr:sugar ABC transporter permease [Longilinea arvoryzae]GAP14339.1 ABC-type sugar transport system, permease component [Longilinea arvoryzae]
MESNNNSVRTHNTLAAIVTSLSVFIIIMIIALMNAPTMGGPKVMASPQTYLAEVKRTALPFLGVVAVGAIALAYVFGRMIYKVWPNRQKRTTTLAAYGFLAPYLLITLTFTVGVVLFAFYISFNNYDIFTSPQWVGLANYKKAFNGFVDPTQKDFIQSLYNVIWYALIVVPLQTIIAVLLAALLNTPIKFRQFFRTVFYAPSVTSSVVITLIFIWLYLKIGYINFFFDKFLGLFGVKWVSILWLGDPRGLIQLIANAFGGDIPSKLWYLRGPSIAWMAIMFQNIFTTAPTFMIMFLAAMQDINPTLFEAAAIDGASKWQQFTKITIPLLRPIILMVVVLGTIGTLQVFDQVYLATSGGPLGTSLTPVYLVYREAMGTQGPIRMGYASALAFILAVIIFAITYVQRNLLERGTEQY